MQSQRKSQQALKVIADFILLTVGYLASVWLAKRHMRITAGLLALDSRELLLLFMLPLLWYFPARGFGLYDDFRSRTFGFELTALFKSCLAQALMVVGILFFLKTPVFSRFFLLVYSLLIVWLLMAWKLVMRLSLSWVRRGGRNLRRILIVGTSDVGQRFFKTIQANPQLGYQVIGLVGERPSRIEDEIYLGRIGELEEILGGDGIDEVVIALPNSAFRQIDRVIAVCENFPARVRIIPDYFKFMSSRFDVSVFASFPIISIRSHRLDDLQWRLLKRLFDLGLSLVLFVAVFSWLWPLLAVIIKWNSPGPVFFKQERWGRRNQAIICYKFRTMLRESRDLDAKGRYRQATANDPRVTRIGRFLRKSSLDELPQFLNVLKGQMSVVGPRPHPIPLNLESKASIRNYLQRHLVKPGLTGWAQVNGYRGETRDPQQMRRRVEYDLWYIENWSFWLDIQIILLTLWRMIRGDPRAY